YGSATSTARTADETAIAKFWSANVVRQYNRLERDVTDARGLDLAQSARLAAMVNVVAADAGISVMYAKYHYLFWRPVTAIDPTSVSADGFGPTPGFDDGNAATVEQAGWRPLLATPNHPEYPAAHGTVTGAMAEVFSSVLGGNQINLDIHGFNPAGAAGNLDAVQHFNTADDLRTQIVNARVWAGLHYRFSGLAGVAQGTSVAGAEVRARDRHGEDPGRRVLRVRVTHVVASLIRARGRDRYVGALDLLGERLRVERVLDADAPCPPHADVAAGVDRVFLQAGP